jgi:hypothetical protein
MHNTCEACQFKMGDTYISLHYQYFGQNIAYQNKNIAYEKRDFKWVGMLRPTKQIGNIIFSHIPTVGKYDQEIFKAALHTADRNQNIFITI